MKKVDNHKLYRKMGFYEKYVKRAIDVVCASAAIICFSPLYIGVAILVKFKLGSPVLFTQDRPGLIGEDGKETIFKMYKFRTMTDERDENGEHTIIKDWCNVRTNNPKEEVLATIEQLASEIESEIW